MRHSIPKQMHRVGPLCLIDIVEGPEINMKNSRPLPLGLTVRNGMQYGTVERALTVAVRVRAVAVGHGGALDVCVSSRWLIHQGVRACTGLGTLRNDI